MFHVKQSLDHIGGLSAHILDVAASLNLPLPGDCADSLAGLADWLATAANQVGLTRYNQPMVLADRLIIPSLLLCSEETRADVGSPMLDFGAGSGAVGLSLAIALPDHEVVLADRRERVIQFIDLAIRRHRLHNCRAVLAGLDQVPSVDTDRYATILIRSFGPAERAVGTALPWLCTSGSIALWHRSESHPSIDGLKTLRTVASNVPSLVLSIYQRI
jgi:16S rRNA G527 N7-methylase RsmG